MMLKETLFVVAARYSI